MRLRNVEPGDLDRYVRTRCDPVMMRHLGGPQPRAGLEKKLARDIARTAADEWWVLTILADGDDPGSVAGGIALWSHDDGRGSEMGWDVLPEYQGRGLARAAAAAVLERARRDGRWGVVHATPSVDNAPSNAVCRSAGFTLAGPVEVDYVGRRLHCNDWWIDTGRPAAGVSG